tara:strand:+ start:636628 stop:637182 length:555 start_codon:yes stop_codon:yes gene_type:complete
MLKQYGASLGAVLLTIWVVGFAMVGCDGLNTPQKTEAINISQLKFKSLDGTDFKLGRHNQKPIILNVWATWCAPCIKELPSLMALGNEGDYALVTVAIDGDAAVVKNFLKKYNFSNLPVVWDRGGERIIEAVGLKGVPTTFIIDTNQEIVATEQGEREWNHPDMKAKIEKYLADAKKARAAQKQ